MENDKIGIKKYDYHCDIIKIIETIEGNGNDKNLFLYLTMVNFAFYINNFPKLKNEKINRIRFYFYNIFNGISKSDLTKFNLNFIRNKTILYIVDELFINSQANKNEESIKASILALTIVFISYKEIANLISKKNIFTEGIEKKILKIITSVVSTLSRQIKILSKEQKTMQDIYMFCNDVIEKSKLKYLKERQNFRFRYASFIEYNNKISEFNIFQNRDDIIKKYEKVILRNIYFEYEKTFFRNFELFLD
jgi:hypothetical protein